MTCRSVGSIGLLALGSALLASCGGDTTGPSDVARVEVTPSASTLDAFGATIQFQAVAKDAQGNGLSGKTFTWSSSAPQVATVEPQSGLVTSVANGTAEIRATTDEITGSATLTVAQLLRIIRGVVTVSNSALSRSGPGAREVFSPSDMGLRPRRTFKRLPQSAATGTSKRPIGIGPARMGPTATPDELLVTFKAAALSAPSAGSLAYSARSTAQAVGNTMTAFLAPHSASGRMTLAGISPAILAARVKVKAAADLDAVASVLRADPAVARVERNTRKFAMGAPAAYGASAPLRPNDPEYPLQAWHYTMIDLPHAWALSSGSQSVLVAVIDDGINAHPDIVPNLTSDGRDFVSNEPVSLCSGTVVGRAGDGDGYDPDPTTPAYGAFDPERQCVQLFEIGNHGLHVAGTIGAVGNNGIGVTGVNWGVRIRPVRVLGVDGGGGDYDIAQGILYAAGLPADDGAGGQAQAPSAARIINMSLGGPGNAGVIENAIIAATNAGSLVIAAAGNAATSEPNYPAAHPQVVSVSAVGPNGQLASYSSFGATVDISAPGGDLEDGGANFAIMSTAWNFAQNAPIYDNSIWNGTSMAAPHVAGVAALLLAREPGLTAARLRDRLESFSVDIGPAGRDDQFGAGLLNARNSLTQSFAPPQALSVRVIDAGSGALVGSVPVAPDGSYEVSELNEGSYYVFAGQDEDGDGLLGLPLRRWGAFGGSAHPTEVDVNAPGASTASFSVGLPVESEPNNALTEAALLPVGGYLVGTIGDPATDVDVTRVLIASEGEFTFETSGPGGACGFALEEDTILELFDQNGVSIAVNDDQNTEASQLCSQITQRLSPGAYYLAVSAFIGSGAAGIPGRRYAISARLGR